MDTKHAVVMSAAEIKENRRLDNITMALPTDPILSYCDTNEYHSTYDRMQ